VSFQAKCHLSPRLLAAVLQAPVVVVALPLVALLLVALETVEEQKVLDLTRQIHQIHHIDYSPQD